LDAEWISAVEQQPGQLYWSEMQIPQWQKAILDQRIEDKVILAIAPAQMIRSMMLQYLETYFIFD
jgi:hypothetical protein